MMRLTSFKAGGVSLEAWGPTSYISDEEFSSRLSSLLEQSDALEEEGGAEAFVSVRKA